MQAIIHYLAPFLILWRRTQCHLSSNIHEQAKKRDLVLNDLHHSAATYTDS